MGIKTISTNRKAYRNYHVQDSLEAGIALTGTEIKSIRDGRVNLADAYVRPENGELWLLNTHIARYDAGSYMSHEPTRPRKLLLHRKEIDNLAGQLARRRVGEPLPGVREVLAACHVGPQTVQAVTHQLEQLGRLEVRPQAGLFRGRVDGPGIELSVQVISFEPGGAPRPHFRAALLAALTEIVDAAAIPAEQHILPYTATVKDVERIVKGIPGGASKVRNSFASPGTGGNLAAFLALRRDAFPPLLHLF